MPYTVKAKFTDGTEKAKAFRLKDEAECFAEMIWGYHDVAYSAVLDGERVLCEFEK